MAGHMFIPSWLRAPSGGWFHTTENANINGVVVLTGYFALLYVLYLQGERNTVNPQKTYSLETVKRWNAAAAKKPESD
ncbi:DEBR0S1_06546g1_1 [Brettanomyces bruxellensis]|uniref:DEBR0S1_06546g1_1 n=1 Tax=Dekkera bruxellensis TaxID=5007 RepID=A0A7D9GX09_DEKBR|nr:DEBR0S1_06546g1_1 [Brettanomyces bruxellensis]